MRLLFIARRYWPAVGGVESFVRQLAHSLANEHTVTVLAQRVDHGPAERLTDSLKPPPTFAAFDDGPVRVTPLTIPAKRRAALAPLITQVTPGLRRYAYGRSRLAAGWLYARVVAPVLRTHIQHADVVHMWGGDLIGVAATRAAQQASVPSVITPFAHRGHWSDDPVSARAYRCGFAVVGLLETDAQLYRDLGVAAERVHVCAVCSRGVGPPATSPEAIRRQHGIDGPLILFLGVRRAYKGFNLLIEAAPRVSARHPDTTFAFVGPGDPVPARTGVRVHDAGVASDGQRSAWMHAADIVCLPSASEIFPVTILEAWSAHTAVVTSDIPPLRELIGRSSGGATSPREPKALAETIIGLLDDPAARARMAEMGHAFWKTHATVETVTAWHSDLYESLLTTRLA